MVLNKEYVTDEEIIELYKQKISQKDISANYAVSLERTRKVLKDAGFPTHTFRATNQDIKKYIIALIKHGCIYFEIEEKCDISFHSVREIVETNNLKGVSRKARFERSKENVTYLYLKNYEPFLNEYRNGYPYVFLCKKHEFNDEQAIYVFNLISEEDIKQHKKGLKEMIIALYEQGLSTTSIASQLDMSQSIVRKIL